MNNLPVQRSDSEYMTPSPYGASGEMQMGGMEGEQAPIKIQRLVGFLKKFWYLPVLTLIAAVSGATIYVLLKDATYVSTGAMWESAKLRLPDGALFAEDLQTYLATQMELLKSVKLRQVALSHMPTNVVPLDKERKQVLPKLKVSQAPKSSVVLLQCSTPNATYSQAFLDALMNEYLIYKKGVRKEVSQDTLASIDLQVQRAEKERKEAIDTLIDYQRTNNLAVMQEESTVAGNYLARLKTQLSDYQLEARLLEATMMETTNSAGTNSLDLMQSFTSFGSANGRDNQPNDRQAAYKDVALLKLQRERLSKYLRPKHPKIVKLDSDIDRAQKLLDIYSRQTRDQLAIAGQSIQIRINNVQSSITNWEAKVIEANARIAQAERLKETVTRNQAAYERVASLQRSVALSSQIDQDSFSVLEPASLAERSYREDFMAFGLAVFAGLTAGIACVLLIALRDDRFTSVTEIAEKLPDEVVGQVPEIMLNGKGSLLLQEGEDRHMYLESYRNLRSALLFLTSESNRPKVILITSALPNEGKSTVSANLARTLAQGGARVLLIDGDLRKGVLHSLLNLQREPGLTELLRKSDGVSVESVKQADAEPNLTFIGSGKRIVNSGDLFLTPGFAQHLEKWRGEYDHVIIDSTPVFAADDATTIAPKVDGTLFIVRNSYSGAGQVREALELLYKRQAKILGVVFNRADASHRSYHYYKYASYYAEAVGS